MSAHAPNFPSREEVAERLRQLISGAIDRKSAANWASQWVTRFDEAGFCDRKLFAAIDSLSAADSISTDRPYLYGQSDFEKWLSDLTT